MIRVTTTVKLNEHPFNGDELLGFNSMYVNIEDAFHAQKREEYTMGILNYILPVILQLEIAMSIFFPSNG